MPPFWGNAPPPIDHSKDWPQLEPGPLLSADDWPPPPANKISLDIPRPRLPMPEPILAGPLGDLRDPDIYAKVLKAIDDKVTCNIVRLREEGFYAHLPNAQPVWEDESPGVFLLCRIRECKDFGRVFVQKQRLGGKKQRLGGKIQPGGGPIALRNHLLSDYHMKLDNPAWVPDAHAPVHPSRLEPSETPSKPSELRNNAPAEPPTGPRESPERHPPTSTSATVAQRPGPPPESSPARPLLHVGQSGMRQNAQS
ncbi:hypothetical protein QBC39DRAFT_436088 [Podospora conica]|nr:hypothetical protein QBC39DRAFT_436088 [Schizothecium conicum]